MLPRHRTAPRRLAPDSRMGRVRVGGVPPAGTLCRSARCGRQQSWCGDHAHRFASLDLDGGEQLSLAHQPARSAGGVSWSGRSRRRSAMAQVMARRWAVVLMLAPARLLLVFEFVIVTKDQRSVVEDVRPSTQKSPSHVRTSARRRRPHRHDPRGSHPTCAALDPPTSPEPHAWRVLPRDPTDNRRPRLAGLSDSITSPIFSVSSRHAGIPGLVPKADLNRCLGGSQSGERSTTVAWCGSVSAV
jgi:hypothetical protein